MFSYSSSRRPNLFGAGKEFNFQLTVANRIKKIAVDIESLSSPALISWNPTRA